jgi:hypothetical protein
VPGVVVDLSPERAAAEASAVTGDVPLPGLDGFTPAGRPQPPAAARPRVTNPQLAVTRRTVQKFWSHVVPTTSDGCAYFIGAVSKPDGYGRFNYTHGDSQRTVLAHRFAMELDVGALDDDVVCEHKCNEPLCVRVDSDHLVLSTQTANMRYAVALGRHSGPIPLDPRGRSRYQRSLDIRAALVNGYDPQALYRAKTNAGPQGMLF